VQLVFPIRFSLGLSSSCFAPVQSAAASFLFLQPAERTGPSSLSSGVSRPALVSIHVGARSIGHARRIFLRCSGQCARARSWFSRVPASNEFFFAVTDLLIVSLSVAARVDSGSFCRRQFSASAHCSFQLVISLRRSLRDSHSPPLKGLGSARQSVPAVLVREGFAARQGRRRSLFASGRGFHDLRPGFIFPSWL
jgi:hypothetical protein